MIESIHKPTWIVQAPTHWPLTRFRYLGNFIGGGTPSKVNTDYWEGGTIPWVSPKDMKSNTIFDTEDHINEIGLKNSPCQLVPPDALLMVVRSGILRNKLPVARNAVPVTLNQDMRALLPISSVSTRFLQYFVQGCEAELLSHWCKDGSTVESIEHDILAGTWLALPPISEQRRITAYLDEQTEKIDRLMDMRRRQMALLKEQRSALIQQAVTRGLNPNVPMKDSGLPWLGEIPEHWEVKPVKHMARILRGRFGHRPRTEPTLYDGPYPFVQTGDVATAKKYLTSYTQTLTEKGYGVSVEFPSGTLLMAIAANIGDLAILGINACLPDSIVGFFPYAGTDVEFLYYQLSCLQSRLRALAPENTQMNLNIDRLSPEKIAVPPQEEQEKICRFINKSEVEIESAFSAYDRQLTLLTEYRAALIHECVTGQRLIPEAASL
jgi:type I restriction enzyme, S subunit